MIKTLEKQAAKYLNNEENKLAKNRNIVPIVKFSDRQQIRKVNNNLRRNFHNKYSHLVSDMSRDQSIDSIKPSSPNLNEMVTMNLSRKGS